jgi:hypothetical protein
MNVRTVRRAPLLLALFAIVGGAWTTGCSTSATTGAFTQVTRLDSELKRGVSTKGDVQQVLGAPTGSGHATFPTDPTPREIWFYQDVEVTDAKREGDWYRVSMRLQVLLVFFKEEIFDGFMWFSNAVPGTYR